MKELNIETIEARLAERGLTQSAVADLLHISREAVSQWFKRNNFPRPAALLALSKVLDLSFEQLVIAEKDTPVRFAFRTNRNQPETPERKLKAQDIASALLSLKPYVAFESLFASPLLANPSSDYGYLQSAASELRRTIGVGSTGGITERDLLGYFRKYATVFVPVLWGKSGDNAIHFCFRDEAVNFIYVNLQKPICDFKYWLVHELAHVLTPQLEGSVSETFAEGLASAVLFPRSAAEGLYSLIEKSGDSGATINRIIEEASSRGISPITVFQGLNAYAMATDQTIIGIDIYPATQNYVKTVHFVSDALFEEDQPSVEKYIRCTAEWFGGAFWSAMTEWLQHTGKSSGAVQRLMDIPMSDAKGIRDYLVSR